MDRDRRRHRTQAQAAVVSVDFSAKHETVHLAGGRLIGIDPGHRDIPTKPWRALELTGVAATP